MGLMAKEAGSESFAGAESQLSECGFDGCGGGSKGVHFVRTCA